MKKSGTIVTLSLTLLFPLLIISCDRPAGGADQSSKRIQELETKVADLEKRLADLTLKNQISGGLIFRSALEEFFHSPNFWENVYDSGEADCSRVCIKNLAAERAACASKPQDERQACYQEASDRAALCHKRCAGVN